MVLRPARFPKCTNTFSFEFPFGLSSPTPRPQISLSALPPQGLEMYYAVSACVRDSGKGVDKGPPLPASNPTRRHQNATGSTRLQVRSGRGYSIRHDLHSCN